MRHLVKQNFRCLFDPFVFPVCFAAHKVVHYSEYLNFSSVSPADLLFFLRINLSDGCREKFGMSNLSNILCRASPCTMRGISKHSCCLWAKLFKVFYEWQEWAETESLNLSISVVSFVFQNRVKCQFLTVSKLSSLLSFNL